VRTAARRPLALCLLAAAGAASASTQVTSEPSPIILGRSPVVALTLQLDPALAAAPGQLHVRANVGDLGNLADAGGGRVKVSYAPPPTKYPQMALLAVWKENGSSPAKVEFIHLPLYGVSKVEASSRPGAEVRARAGDQTYGPEIAGKNGEAVVTVPIPPGTRDLVLLAKVAGITTERTVGIETPPYNQLAAVVTPSALGPGFNGVGRLDVLYDVSGAVEPAVIHARASAGTLTFEKVEGTRLTWRWELRGAAPREVTFTVTADGDATSSASVALRPAAESGFALRLGARVGLTHSLGALAVPRYGLEVSGAFNPGGVPLELGLTAGYGSAQQLVNGPTAAPLTRADVTMLPLALRLGFAPVRLGGVSLVGGAGFTTTFTRYQTFDQADALGEELWRLAPSALLFAGGAWRVGPGQFFGEVVLSWAGVNDPSFRIQTGGVGLEVGYRFEILRGR
jgi:hypothetical protein